MRVRVRAGAMTTMTLRLAEAFAVRGVYAPGFGRLLHLRVVGQNSLIVNLPSPVFRDNEFTLTIVYGGRLEPSELDREAIDLQAQQEHEPIAIPLEPRYIYSNNSSGIRSRRSPTTRTARCGSPCRPNTTSWRRARSPGRRGRWTDSAAARGQKMFMFQNDRPVRYLACVISRMSPVVSTQAADQVVGRRLRRSSRRGARSVGVRFQPARRSSSSTSVAEPSAPAGTASDETSVTLTVKANPRQVGRARDLAEQTSAILQFYASIVGDAPYPTLHPGADRERPAGRPQPGVLRRAQPVAADRRPSSGATIR